MNFNLEKVERLSGTEASLLWRTKMNKENKTTSRTPVLDALMDEIDPLEAKRTGDRMLIAARIGELIKERGWNKSYFAIKAGQQPSVISKWLSGTHNFTLDTLTEISNVLEVTLSELFREKPQELVFRSNFAVTGLAGTTPSPMYYGGSPAIPNSKPAVPDMSPEDRHEYIRRLGQNIVVFTVPHHGSPGQSRKSIKGGGQERSYALKA